MKRTTILFIGTLIFVCLIGSNAMAKVIKVPGDYPTIQEAVDAAKDGDKIIVDPGYYAGAEIYKRLEIKGSGNNTRIIYPCFDGAHSAFVLRPGSDGSEISHLVIDIAIDDWYSVGIHGGFHGSSDIKIHHLEIKGLILRAGIYSGGGVNDGWTISHNEITGATYAIYIVWGNGWKVSDNTLRENELRGIYLYGSSNCEIIHNTIDGLKGDVVDGILLDPTRWDPANNNLIAFNDIIHEVEETGFQYHGIRLISNNGTARGNIISHNKISVSNPIATQYSVAIALRDLVASWGGEPVITDNIIEFNDLRGSSTGILFCPPDTTVYRNDFYKNSMPQIVAVDCDGDPIPVDLSLKKH